MGMIGRVMVAVVFVAGVAAVDAASASLPPQSPPAAWTLSRVDGPVGTDVTLTITYEGGITRWCTEEVEGAPVPDIGATGWSVALLLSGPGEAVWSIPEGWSRQSGLPALPLGPLPDSDTATVTFSVPDGIAPGTYVGVGGCVSPDGGQPGPGLAEVTFTVTDTTAPVPVAAPRFNG